MRIRATVEQLTPAQWDWLLNNLRQEWAFDQDAVRVCVEFESPDGLDHRHMELEARQWVEALTRLQALEQTAQAILTPDALSDIARKVWDSPTPDDPGLKLGRIGTNSGHGHVWNRPDRKRKMCGGPAMCNECAEDLKLAGGFQ